MKSKKMIYHFLFLGLILLLATSCSKDDDGNGTVTDIDGNVYHTVKIGTQVWMVENLKVTKFNNGEEIEIVTGEKSADSWPTPLYCWYNNDPIANEKYGVLYNYRIVHQTYLVPLYIAPKGWHVPSDEDWKTLADYLGGELVAGGKLKSKGTLEANNGLWHSPNSGATNEAGFSALPGGLSDNLNSFSSFQLGYIGAWWSSSYNQGPSSYYMFSTGNNIFHSNENTYNSDFKSIRCIKD